MGVCVNLPTPTSGDSKASRNRTAKRSNPDSAHHDGLTLTDAVSSASSPGSEDSTSPSNPEDGDASDRSRTSLPVSESSNDGGRLFPVGPTSEGSGLLPTPTDGDSFKSMNYGRNHGELDAYHGMRGVVPTEASSISSREASRSCANPSPTLASATRKPTIAGSGPSSPVSFASLDPDGSWLKTYPDSSVQATLMGPPLVKFSGTWPKRGSMHDGQVFELPMSEPAIDESASSYSLNVPTPTSSDSSGRGTSGKDRGGPNNPDNYATNHNVSLVMWANALLPTPNAGTTPNGHGRRGGQPNGHQSGNLNEVLATPTAWLGRRPAHSKGDPKRWTNPERSNELSDQIAFLGESTQERSQGGKP